MKKRETNLIVGTWDIRRKRSAGLGKTVNGAIDWSEVLALFFLQKIEVNKNIFSISLQNFSKIYWNCKVARQKNQKYLF